MTTPSKLPNGLAAWLEYIEALHPKSIAMGLGRVNEVKQRLHLDTIFPVIIVAGTNGKGSTCAMLERIYHEAGYRVGCYASPHLLRYNERVRVACQEVSDDDLCNAFAAVEHARQAVALTYFEFGTLAAFWHFAHAGLDVAVLEVGLGGRLDAVNVFDPACSIVTSIDMDHMDFLGNTREHIGYEKAGVFRSNVPAICGDMNPPASLLSHASQIHADLRLIGRDFSFKAQPQSWRYIADGTIADSDLPFPALVGDFQLMNASAVMAAIDVLQPQLPVNIDHITQGLNNVSLSGRFQKIAETPEVLLDVAHNPHAARALAGNLASSTCEGQTIAIFAMLADKDIPGVVAEVVEHIDCWYVADIDNVRGAKAVQLDEIIMQISPDAKVKKFTSVNSAYQQACLDVAENDRIIVCGSFFTVADVMKASPAIYSEH
ncbi:bifunctional folylpolyglutamate synthase/dihydrofolate synthase [Methylovorus sp. MM2]|uniref:bifunctional tetrahydrofolate synthase/dihydrofolate synthase n=1 Tax=Methylovorus sp. MM2 TaxID=1848038 RepID=UPI0007DEDAE6|nr:bifunctional tetrahydrofolate synthase/dihydrofolate synthase [Methylovorus sp. MM2]OAM52842.1 bifunctional folylpolyglutamate synthase/dihydrofolate synthase [Methylovorus sp. MM2]